MNPSAFLLVTALLLTAWTPDVRALSDDDEPDRAPALNNVTEIGILPGFKKGAAVDVDERNPYARRVVEVAQGDDRETEALQLRRILEGLTVRGRSRGAGGQRVLLGALRLEEGKEIPPLIQNQSDRLIVSAITDEEIEISWIAESGEHQRDARSLRIPIKVNHDSVRMRLNTGVETKGSENWITVPFNQLRSLNEYRKTEQADVTGP